MASDEQDEISVSLAAIIRTHTVTGLMPFTQYSVRIRACLQGIVNSCASGRLRNTMSVTLHDI